MKDKIIVVNDIMQQNYTYTLVEPMGRNFANEFLPDLSPKEMLQLGVFGGKYMTDCGSEFPADWFIGVKLCHEKHVPEYNYFGINASQPLSVWREKGWIFAQDPRGWFQWYCRYYLGRRIPLEDQRQIKRWKAIKRHIAQVKKNCDKGDLKCRARQRQAILHWAYDSRKI